MPSKQTGLTRRKGSNVYQFEIRIPESFAQFHDSKRSFRQSLGTRDPREAKLKAALLKAEWETKFAEQRKALTAHQSRRVESINPELADELAALVLHDALSDDE